MAAPANEFFPQELAEDIFSCLPIKSVIRFKSVSKPFRSSLSNPAFTRLHYHRSKSYKDDTKFLLLSEVNNQAFVIASCPRHDPKDPALSMTISNFDLFPKIKSPERVIIGSGEGLFCTYTDKKGIEVWNPSTRELRLLPELGRPSFGGICYDPRIDDYKVVVFFDNNYAVLELKGKCWRMSGSHTDSSYTGLDRPTEPINGAIYWMIRGFFVIYSFDLLKEELTKITPPPNWDSTCELGQDVLHGCLCMVKYEGIRLQAERHWVWKEHEVWIMKEHGVWIKLNSIEEGSMFVSNTDCKVYKFVDGSWRGYCLHICNLEYEKPICVQHDYENSTCRVRAVCPVTKVIQYSQSLISPFVTP